MSLPPRFSPWTAFSLAAVLLFAGCGGDSGDEATPASESPRPMVGMFTYMADAGMFTDCATGTRIPVAHEGDNAALERAYLTVSPAPAAPVLVTVEGLIAERPSMEGNKKVQSLVVSRFLNAWPGETCQSSTVETPLANTYWKLITVAGDTVRTHADQREVHILLEQNEPQVRGFAGCNQFFGSYETTDGVVKFGQLASTRAMCPYIDDESALFRALEQVSTYEILGESLELRGENGTVIRFKAVYLE
jgi:copper homeostasis protein (lipoprotein)